MKRRLFAAILAALVLAALILPAAADTFIYLWTSNLHDEPEDPMAFTSYSAAEGYKTPSRVYDYEKLAGNMDSLEEAGRLEGVHLRRLGVWSDYVSRAFRVAENLAPNTYNEKFADLPVEPGYALEGIRGLGKDSSFTNFEEGSFSIKEETLQEALNWSGLGIAREGENSLNSYYGRLTFNYNPCILVETLQLDYLGEMKTYTVEYVVMLSLDYYIQFSFSNVTIKDGRVHMDIDGREGYRYSVTTDLNTNFHSGMAYIPPAEEEAKDRAREQYDVFRKETRKEAPFSENLHSISIKDAAGVFELRDVEGGKNLVLRVEKEGLRLEFIVDGVLLGDPVIQNVEQNAGDNPGEDGGTELNPDIVEGRPGQAHDPEPGKTGEGGISVPGAIGLSLAGTAAAGIGAGAVVGGSGDEKKKPGPRKKYIMYIQKDFGDALRRGAKPVTVRARMAEADGKGAQRDRDDLTAKITAQGRGLEVRSLSFAGRYMEAQVFVPAGSAGDRAAVTFTFTGPGGAFNNTVSFRLVDGPSLRFCEETGEAGAFRLGSAGTTLEMIPGDGFTYREKFMLVDATVPPEPEDMTSDKVPGFEISFKKTARQYVYELIVKNNTPAEKNEDIFRLPTERDFTLRVRVQGEEKPVEGYVTLRLWPEGITVASQQKGEKNGVKYLRVQAFERENAGAMDKKWLPSRFEPTLAVRGQDKALINPKGVEFTFEKLEGAGGLGTRADKEENLAKKYEYRLAADDRNGRYVCDMEPGAHLCEPADGTFLMVLLPMGAAYEGQTFSSRLPVRLRGKDPDPMEGWEEEYKKLRERIEEYSLSAEKDKWLHKLELLALEPRCSTVQLRLVSKAIIRNYMRYWLIESTAQRNEAEIYDTIVSQLEWVKFFGDCAFSLLVSAYAGPVAEAVISPAKDYFTSAIGELIAAANYGEKIDITIVERFEFVKNLTAAGDNLVGGAISITSWRTAAATLGGYFVYASIRSYFTKLKETGESDLFGALTSGFADMTVNALKAGASKLLGKWLEGETFQKKIGPYITKYVKETKFVNLQARYNAWQQLYGDLALKGASKEASVALTDVVDKYIVELFGAGIGKVKELTVDKVNTSSRFEYKEGALYFTFALGLSQYTMHEVSLNLNRMLMNIASPGYTMLYDLIFGQVPAAESTIQVPKDPPLPPEKK